MATSRTGTSKWKHARTRALHTAQAQNITHCPCKDACKHHRRRRCNTELDYATGRNPNSAVPDHIKHHALGGTDNQENLTIICYRCNAADGGRLGNTLMRSKRTQHIPTIRF